MQNLGVRTKIALAFLPPDWLVVPKLPRKNVAVKFVGSTGSTTGIHSPGSMCPTEGAGVAFCRSCSLAGAVDVNG